jgi:hypothetical protein
MVIVRSLRIVAMRKVRGRDKDVSSISAIPPNYESLNKQVRISLFEAFVHTRNAVIIAQRKEDLMMVVSEEGY